MRPVRGLFGMPEGGVEERQMEGRLIRDRELPEVDSRHLRHFVDLAAVPVDAVVRFQREEGVELFEKMDKWYA